MAQTLAPGGAVFLAGPLGVGKTALVQSIVSHLKSSTAATSPTFDLVHYYASPQASVIHVDGYRLGALNEWDVLDLPALLGPGVILLVEWGEAIAQRYPDRLQIALSLDAGSQGRRAWLTPFGDGWPGRIEALLRVLRA